MFQNSHIEGKDMMEILGKSVSSERTSCLISKIMESKSDVMLKSFIEILRLHDVVTYWTIEKDIQNKPGKALKLFPLLT